MGVYHSAEEERSPQGLKPLLVLAVRARLKSCPDVTPSADRIWNDVTFVEPKMRG